MYRALAVCSLLIACPLILIGEDPPAKKAEAKSIEGAVVRASSIAGMEVRSPDNKNLGSVEDIVVDTQTGAVQYAAVSFGGFLGIGNKLFAVPFKALHVRHEAGSKTPHFEINVTKEALESAKGFDKNNWPNFSDPNFAKSNDKYFLVIEVKKDK